MKTLLWGIIFPCLFCASYGQTARPSVFRFSTDHGLPQNSVKKITFDRWGFCWLATEMGVVRYDGRAFKVYGTAEIKGLRSERIEDLNADQRGNLFVRSADGQLMEIRREASMLAPAPQLVDEQYTHLPRQGPVIHDQALLPAIDRFYREDPGKEVFGTASMPDGDAYFFSAGGLYYIRAGMLRPVALRTYVHGETLAHVTVEGGMYVTIHSGNSVDVWLRGRRRLDITRISGSLESEGDFAGGRFQAYANRSGTFIYTHKNLHKLSLQGHKLVSVKVLDQVDVPALHCVYFAADQGRYYLGSLTDGLFIAQPSRFIHPRIPDMADEASFYVQARRDDSTIFCGDLEFRIGQPVQKVALGSVLGSGADFSERGELYFQRRDSILRHDFKTGKSTQLLTTRERLVYVRADAVHPRSYVFATERDMGSVVTDRLVARKPFPESIKVISVTDLGGAHYLLGTENGLKWYDFRFNRLYRSLLDAVPVRAAWVENPDRIWIATYGKGFYLYEKHKLYKMPLGPKRALKTVHSFIDDGHGFFWLPTNNGLFKVSKAELLAYASGEVRDVYYFLFNTNDGLITNEFNGGSDNTFGWLKDSLLSISSLKGLVWFYPNRLTPHYPTGRIYVDSLRIDERPVAVRNKVELPPDFTTMSLQICSPYFGNPENMNLQYMVKGTDDRWHVMANDGVLWINNLPAGRYELHFRRGGTADRKELLVIPMRVNPYFYRTWLFYLICITMSALVFYLVIRQRTRHLRRKSEALEKIVSSRTDELRYAVEELGRSEMALLESNRFKDRVITMVLHDLRSPLRFISLISSRLLNSPPDTSREALKESLSDLHMGTQNLLGFTEQFFLWINSQQQGFRVTKSRFRLKTLFEEAADLYGDILRINHNRLSIRHSDVDCYTDYQILLVIIRNLIDNANKNTRDGVIRLLAAKEGSELTICVEDTGAGMTPAQVASFMSPEKDITNHGTGSVIIHQMLLHIDAAIAVESEAGKGSTFMVRLFSQEQSDAAGQGDSVPASF